MSLAFAILDSWKWPSLASVFSFLCALKYLFTMPSPSFRPVKKNMGQTGYGKFCFATRFSSPGSFLFNVDVGFTLAHQRGERAARRTFMPGHLESEMANCNQRAYEEWCHIVDEAWWRVWTCKSFAFSSRLPSERSLSTERRWEILRKTSLTLFSKVKLIKSQV